MAMVPPPVRPGKIFLGTPLRFGGYLRRPKAAAGFGRVLSGKNKIKAVYLQALNWEGYQDRVCPANPFVAHLHVTS